MQLNYLIKVRVEAVFAETGEMPSDESVARWRENTKRVLEEQHGNN
jgi:hypothetical protein